MEDSTDFTFCQVGLQVDDDALESPKTIPNGKDSIHEDSLSNGVGVLKIDDKIRDSNNVNDILPPKFQVKESPTQKVVSNSIDSAEGSQEKKPGIKKAVARAKVPFEKGYSQMDWLKLTRTHPDLAGLKGQSNRRFISMAEVRQHKTGDSIWTVLKGHVYNISPYMKFHPGGVDMLMKAAGKDSTSLFNKYHAWVNFEFLLEKCLVGILEDSL